MFGSVWTYGGAAAPGQTSVAELIGSYRVRSTSPATAVYALIGAPLAHSASPAMLNAAFGSTGIDAVYVPMETRDAPAFLTAAAALGVTGASVTAPLKSGWAERGVQVDEVGRAVGAINTLKRTSAGWSARNFDVDGFLAPFKVRQCNLQGTRVVVLGAGGAARAVAWALKREGAAVGLSARRAEAATALAADLGADAVAWPPDSADILINATPVGTWPDADKAPIASGAGGSARIVYDLVYNPPETRLLRHARAAGAEIIGGLEMLIAQAELQFTYWTDRPAPAGVMEQAAVAFLRKRNA
jgi:shikimate dehydrogenase